MVKGATQAVDAIAHDQGEGGRQLVRVNAQTVFPGRGHVRKNIAYAHRGKFGNAALKFVDMMIGSFDL